MSFAGNIANKDVVVRADESLEGVTPGEWTWTHGLDSRCTVLGPDNLVIRLEGHSDARFVAQSRGLVPELRDEVKRLRDPDGAIGSILDYTSRSAQNAVRVLVAVLGNASEGTLDPDRAADIAQRALTEAVSNVEGK